MKIYECWNPDAWKASRDNCIGIEAENECEAAEKFAKEDDDYNDDMDYLYGKYTKVYVALDEDEWIFEIIAKAQIHYYASEKKE